MLYNLDVHCKRPFVHLDQHSHSSLVHMLYNNYTHFTWTWSTHWATFSLTDIHLLHNQDVRCIQSWGTPWPKFLLLHLYKCLKQRCSLHTGLGYTSINTYFFICTYVHKPDIHCIQCRGTSWSTFPTPHMYIYFKPKCSLHIWFGTPCPAFPLLTCIQAV